MKSKLHFGILIALFIILGRYVESSVSANQQIVIQFSDADITKNSIQSTIETIQNKLHKIGVDHISVGHHQEGQLKITYYSNNNVEQIKKILSEEQGLKFAFSPTENSKDHPEQEITKDYELNISEIQKHDQSTDWDFEGIEIAELTHKGDRFNNVKVSSSGSHISSVLMTNSVSVVVKRYYALSIAQDRHSYKIPEVRAGPMT